MINKGNFLLTEKSINDIIIPIRKLSLKTEFKNFPIEKKIILKNNFDFEIMSDSDENISNTYSFDYISNNYFSFMEFSTLDSISLIILKTVYDNIPWIIEESVIKNYAKLKNKLIHNNKEFVISIDLDNLNYFFPIKKASLKLLNYIKLISENFFSFDYPIRVLRLNDEKILPSYEYIKVSNENIFNFEKNGNYVTLTFTSNLGKYFLLNLISLNNLWIPSEIYNLPELDNLFYRKFFILERTSKRKKMVLSLGEIKEKIFPLVEGEYSSLIKNRVIKSLEIFKKEKLISDYKFVTRSIIEIIKK